MLGGHLPELLIVLVLALVVFGPKRLPEIGSSLGRGIRDFRKGVTHMEESTSLHEPTRTEPVTKVTPKEPVTKVVSNEPTARVVPNESVSSVAPEEPVTPSKP